MKLYMEESRNFWFAYAHVARHMGMFDAAVRATDRAMSKRVVMVHGDNGETLPWYIINGIEIAVFGPRVKE